LIVFEFGDDVFGSDGLTSRGGSLFPPSERFPGSFSVHFEVQRSRFLWRSFGSLASDRVLCSSTGWNLGPICLVRSQGS
jgi:hypothetical protein